MYTSAIVSGMNKILFTCMFLSLFHWHPQIYCVTVHSFWILTVTWTLGYEDKIWFTKLPETSFIFLDFVNLENNSQSSLFRPLSRGQPESPRHRPQEP